MVKMMPPMNESKLKRLHGLPGSIGGSLVVEGPVVGGEAVVVVGVEVVGGKGVVVGVELVVVVGTVVVFGGVDVVGTGVVEFVGGGVGGAEVVVFKGIVDVEAGVVVGGAVELVTVVFLSSTLSTVVDSGNWGTAAGGWDVDVVETAGSPSTPNTTIRQQTIVTNKLLTFILIRPNFFSFSCYRQLKTCEILPNYKRQQ